MVEEQLHDRLRDASADVEVAEVVDDDRYVDLTQQRKQLNPFVPGRVDLCAPAKPLDARDGASKFIRARRDLELLPEIEACPADTGLVQAPQLAVADVIIDDGDTAVVRTRRRERIIQNGMIGSVHG